LFGEDRSNVADTPSDVIIVLSRFHRDRWQSAALIDTTAAQLRSLRTGYGKKSRRGVLLWISETQRRSAETIPSLHLRSSHTLQRCQSKRRPPWISVRVHALILNRVVCGAGLDVTEEMRATVSVSARSGNFL
jgi:hypothetical protein